MTNTLDSKRFRGNERLLRAANNNPPMRRGENGLAVRIVQQTLVDLGYPLPQSTQRYETVDGLYGYETLRAVEAFQKANTLSPDGIAGANTIMLLDGNAAAERLSAILPPTGASGRYVVPGRPMIITQRDGVSDNLCWAFCYAMLYSWRHSVCVDPKTLIDELGKPWTDHYRNNVTISYLAIGRLARATGLQTSAPAAPTPLDWVTLLRRHGLLCVLRKSASFDYDHVELLAGVFGDGNPESTTMLMLNPGTGRATYETFAGFDRRYRGVTSKEATVRILHW